MNRETTQDTTVQNIIDGTTKVHSCSYADGMRTYAANNVMHAPGVWLLKAQDGRNHPGYFSLFCKDNVNDESSCEFEIWVSYADMLDGYHADEFLLKVNSRPTVISSTIPSDSTALWAY